MSPRVRKGLVFGLVVGAIGLLCRPIGLRLEEEVALPWLFALRGPETPPADVAVVSIDKASAQQLGLDTTQWPPPRSVHARVIRALNRLNVSTIVMDIWFGFPRSDLDDDELARAMRERHNVVLVQRLDRARTPGTTPTTTDLLQSPIAKFQQAAVALAPFPLPRRQLTPFFWPFFDTSAGRVPTLPATALQVHALPLLEPLQSIVDPAGTAPELSLTIASVDGSRDLMQFLRRTLGDPAAARTAMSRLNDASRNGLTGKEASLLAALLTLYSGPDSYYLNFYGPSGTIETIPFHELLRDEGHSARQLTGRVVFVGEGSLRVIANTDQPDTYPTVFSTHDGAGLSGVEIGATAFGNLITGRTLKSLGPLASFAVLVVFGGVIGFLARALPGKPATAVTLLVAVSGAAVAQWLFASRALLVPMAVPLVVQLPIALFVGLWSHYRDMRRQVPIELDPDAGQQLFFGVCLATDVKGFTHLTELLQPHEIHGLLDQYFAMLRRLVEGRQGLVWGRGGDSALSVWKASPPRWWRFGRGARRSGVAGSERDVRLRACLAAVDIRDAIDEFNTRHPSAKQLPTRLGLEAGDIGLGPVAGELQAVGDPATTASRVEALNRHLGTKLLASARVVEGLHELSVRCVGSFVLPGKSHPLTVFEIFGRTGARSEDDRRGRDFAEALKLFEAGQWVAAANAFARLEGEHPDDGPSRYYRELCRRYAENPFDAPSGMAVHIERK